MYLGIYNMGRITRYGSYHIIHVLNLYLDKFAV